LSASILGREVAHTQVGERGHRISIRTRVAWYSLAVDLAIALISYELALLVFSWFHDESVMLTPERFDWGLPAGLTAIVITFLFVGLYTFEVYSSRPLHLAALAKACVIALVVTAFLVFCLKSPYISESRLTVFSEFFLFFVLDALVRLTVLDGIFAREARHRRGGSVVIGYGADSSLLAQRCRELRGFAPVVGLEPVDRRRNGHDAEPALLARVQTTQPAPRQVFLDSSSLGHKAILDLVAASRARGCEVYITGRLLSALDTTRLLLRLFETPVMRVRAVEPALGRPPRAKRAFDVVASAAFLLVLAPLFAVIAILIKADSPGPVFFRQKRIGLHGDAFEFLKFRTMQVDNDDSTYREHMLVRIRSEREAHETGLADEFGRPMLKLGDDPRVTRVGAFLRKYSLDELPQFLNVLRGDMSIVGPRPALDYEVAAYTPWHERRLDVMPGVSGLWQVAGRSRVTFDEMVFQDVLYSYNECLFTDVNLCLRTLPAMLNGRGAA
jgi:exopolysaccharide biosynthesis polyprenyl glycosylphosphotransferase